MDIIQRLNQAQKKLSDSRVEERRIINQLFLYMFGKNELPKTFQISASLDNSSVKAFLKEELELDVKEVEVLPISLLAGITYKVVLN